MDLRSLSDEEVVKCQERGYFDEHLASLYSTCYGQPYLFEEKYLLYHDAAAKTVSLTLFELDRNRGNQTERQVCFRVLAAHFKPEKVIVTSPSKLPSHFNAYCSDRVYEDKDYQITLSQFDESLKGGEYKSLRYRVNHAKKSGYALIAGKSMTPAHIGIMAEFLAKAKNLELWDYMLYLGLGEYLTRFASPRFFNVYLDDLLIGFDVVDFLGDVMAVPLGFYLDYPSIADFLVFEEILQAKTQGFKWLDIGWACNTQGLEEFKTKWKAVPRFPVHMQVFKRT